MSAAVRTGYRLDRLEIYNWGTFHGRAWTLALGGENGLLTGDIGSGKSTLVDAVTTLLLPANRISYNKAAGAEVRERSLRSYVMGYYKSERNETTGSSQPVGLRGNDSFSVILGVFRNDGYDTTVTVAQVFWMRTGNQGQPDRFFVTADRALSVAEDFADFGSDIAALRRRLRTGKARVYDHFPEYGRDFRRRLGIESDQAMELFHQTVSMKSVGDLNDFVRHHMLEPFEAKQWIDALVSHFDDLTKAHDAVVKARTQLAALAPLLADCDTVDQLTGEIDQLTAERSALPFFCADRKAELLRQQIGELTEQVGKLDQERAGAEVELSALDERRRGLELERAGHGGERLGQIERELVEANRLRQDRQDRAAQFNQRLQRVGLPAVERAEQFPARRQEVDDRLAQTKRGYAEVQNQLTDVDVDRRELSTQADRLNTELQSLRSRRSNLPARSLQLRAWLCQDLAVPESALPFAGELIQVRPEWAQWEGAAERLLRGFGLSLLVPEEHYPAVSDWINDHHLNARLVYYRVPRVSAPPAGPAREHSAGQLVEKLAVKDCEVRPWLESELARRAGYECVESMADFRRANFAITKSGQVKSAGGRHEKDDRSRIDDRSSYVLGWSNEQKIDALLAQMTEVQHRLNQLTADRDRLRDEMDSLQERRDLLVTLAETRGYGDLDWPAMVTRINDLTAERERIEAASTELERIANEIVETTQAIDVARRRERNLTTRIGGLQNQLDTDRAELTRAEQRRQDPGYEAAVATFARLTARVDGAAMTTPDGCDRLQADLAGALTDLITNRSARLRTAEGRAVRKMVDFRQNYPLETVELDDSAQSAGEYRALHRRLVDDDLPRFEAQFKTYLNTNTIRDIAGFYGQLNKQKALIKERIETINDSLLAIDYNDGRYIRLEGHPSPNTEVRDFRAELRACTDGAVSGDDSDQYSEQKFLQVKRIVERFRGRPGQADVDRLWARKVTDVRNWFVFSASERWRKDDSEHENYTDSGGKSGGQKEKLAYTILAASLAYQFKLEWDAKRSKAFQFVVIDEAFGRGSDESTRYALKLFGRLGLQLLIVTPLQKIHVIEPYVAAVGFVDNTKEGDCSRLQTMTIEEYQERRLAHHARGPEGG